MDIDERGSAFPGGGWLTRRGLEGRIPEWGAKALSTVSSLFPFEDVQDVKNNGWLIASMFVCFSW